MEITRNPWLSSKVNSFHYARDEPVVFRKNRLKTAKSVRKSDYSGCMVYSDCMLLETWGSGCQKANCIESASGATHNGSNFDSTMTGKSSPLYLALLLCSGKTVGWLLVGHHQRRFSVSKLMSKLWKDDCGALIAAEYLFIATILVIGIVVGLTSVRDAINTELAELANAYLALSQGYVISGQSGCSASSDGSQAIDTPALVTDPTNTPPFIPSVIDALPCN